MQKEINLQQLPYELDERSRWRAAIGLVVLATDQVIEHEFRMMLAMPGVALYQSRIRNETRINAKTLAEMETRLGEALDMILPGMPMDVVAFGCTSASMVIGPSRIAEICRKTRPGVQVTNPFSAALEALNFLNSSSIALLTPYCDDLNQQFRSMFHKEGIEVQAMGSFNEENDNLVGRISPVSIKQAVLKIGKYSKVDAVFISCTNLRIAEGVSSLEKQLGKPVISSNLAMAWHALSLAGILDPQPRWGRLFKSG